MASEKDLDRALHIGLEENDAFRSWFISRLAHRNEGYSRLVFCRSDNPWCRLRLSLPNPDSGTLEAMDHDSETDVLAVFENSSGQRLGVQIENKLASGSFTRYQPDVYAARAEHWVQSDRYGSYDKWETVLLAPQAFIERNATEVKKFTTRITHEQVAQFLSVFGHEGDA